MTKNFGKSVSLLWYFLRKKPVMRLMTLILLLGAFRLTALAYVDGDETSYNLQEKTVNGRIIDAAGNNLAGVNVIEKGTTNGAISNPDGRYSITVASPNSTLVFSFIGYATQEVIVGTRGNIDITLVESVSSLQEVVVVGYGTRLREELTGSVSSISSQQMIASTAPSVIGRMQGQVSGVTIIDGNTPGSGASILVRGLGTIQASTGPLMVIDGIPAGPGSSLNPNDIESISVLKDASSAAIYGSRGANGVVLITTKRGRAGDKAKVTLNARTGITKAINQYDLLNTQEYGELLWLQAENRGIPPTNALYGNGTTPAIPDYILPAAAKEGDASVNPALYQYPSYTIIKANKEGTRWYDEIYHNGVIQDYNLSITGGGQNTSYAFSAGYLNEEGFIIHSSFERFTLRSNTDVQLNNWLKIGQSLSLSYTVGKGNRGDNDEGSVISQAYRSQPIIPIYDIMGNFAGSKAPTLGNSANPVAVQIRSRMNRSKNYRALGNFFTEARIIQGLSFKTLFGFDVGPWMNYSYGFRNPEHSEPAALDSFSESAGSGLQWNWTNTLNFDRTFADIHRVSAILGTEAIASRSEDMSGNASQYFSQDFDYMQLSTGETSFIVGGGASETSQFSIFGRVNYALRSRYLFEATLRRDGSSRFSKTNRWGTFPAASAAWVLSEESFMSGTSSWLSFLKLRLGWGLSGNDRIGEYQTFTTYGIHSSLSAYAIDGGNLTRVVGFQPSRYGNPDITWESTETRNLGVDAQFLNNTINLSFDVWQRKTTDMLYRLNKPEVTGVATYPYVNVGEMANNGFDIELGYKNNALAGKFTYSISAELSHYKNEIVKLGLKEGTIIDGYNTRQFTYTKFRDGTSYPEFWGYTVEGIFQTQPEADAWPKAFGAAGTYNMPGHFKFSDISGPDGVPDNIINASDMTFIGSPHPDFTAGLNVDLTYTNFYLNMSFYAVYGNEIINYVRRWIDYSQFLGNRSKDRLYKSWGSPYLNSNADAKLAMADLDTGSEQPSTHFLENGSFLRMKSLQLGYVLPQSIVSKMGIQGISVYGQVSNLFTLTKYSGLDPELNSSGTSMGVDRGAWPTPRQVMFGLTLDL
jgi:TonB-linked SusC/RagA family outer membrane protein